MKDSQSEHHGLELTLIMHDFGAILILNEWFNKMKADDKCI